MSFDRKLERYNLNIFFYLNIWKGRDSQCFTCHLMASLNECYFSIQLANFLMQNRKQLQERASRAVNAVLFKQKLPKHANCHSKQRNLYSEFSHIYYL